MRTGLLSAEADATGRGEALMGVSYARMSTNKVNRVVVRVTTVRAIIGSDRTRRAGGVLISLCHEPSHNYKD